MKVTSNEVPPGATRKALDRPLDPGGGLPGSGAGPRHAAADEGSDLEDAGPMDTNRTPASAPLDEEDTLEAGPAYAGLSGGAVGGTPAQGRSSGGNLGRRQHPERRHGESTIGSDPHQPPSQK
jgi:hypothetical protein